MIANAIGALSLMIFISNAASAWIPAFLQRRFGWDTHGLPAELEAMRQLGITEATVKAHLSSAFQRLGVRDRTQAALWMQRHEL